MKRSDKVSGKLSKVAFLTNPNGPDYSNALYSFWTWANENLWNDFPIYPRTYHSYI